MSPVSHLAFCKRCVPRPGSRADKPTTTLHPPGRCGQHPACSCAVHRLVPACLGPVRQSRQDPPWEKYARLPERPRPRVGASRSFALDFAPGLWRFIMKPVRTRRAALEQPPVRRSPAVGRLRRRCSGTADTTPRLSISSVKVFGDSIQDSGTFGYKFTVQTPGNNLIYAERIATNYGQTPVQFLCLHRHLLHPTAKAGCTNFAIWRAHPYTGAGGAANPLNIGTQMATYASMASFAASDLVIIDGGGNDAADLVGSLPEGAFRQGRQLLRPVGHAAAAGSDRRGAAGRCCHHGRHWPGLHEGPGEASSTARSRPRCSTRVPRMWCCSICPASPTRRAFKWCWTASRPPLRRAPKPGRQRHGRRRRRCQGA